MLTAKIFVYGTLMENFRNYNKYHKGKVTSIETAYIYGKLYHLNVHNCPAIIDGRDKVYGEVITFTDDNEKTVLNAVDNFEKNFFDRDEIIYERKPADVYYLDDRRESLSFYKLINMNVLERENAEYIASGSWKKYLRASQKVL